MAGSVQEQAIDFVASEKASGTNDTGVYTGLLKKLSKGESWMFPLLKDVVRGIAHGSDDDIHASF